MKYSKSAPIKWGAIILFLSLISSVFAQQKPRYLDSQEPVIVRVKDLMDRMSLEMKIAQMCQYVGLEHMRDAEKNITEEGVRFKSHIDGKELFLTPELSIQIQNTQ